jgi:hypothetical protein
VLRFGLDRMAPILSYLEAAVERCNEERGSAAALLPPPARPPAAPPGGGGPPGAAAAALAAAAAAAGDGARAGEAVARLRAMLRVYQVIAGVYALAVYGSVLSPPQLASLLLSAWPWLPSLTGLRIALAAREEARAAAQGARGRGARAQAAAAAAGRQGS